MSTAADNASPVRHECGGGVATVWLNRPEKLNALDLEMRQALSAVFETLNDDPGIRAIIVTGGDTVFAAGADLRLLADKSPAGVRELGFPALWRPIADSPKPVIAAVAGYALGAGCELALMCDIIVADPSAQFGQPECKVGVMPGAGGSQRLIRAVGKPVASLLLMTGGTLAAERAYQLGLVSELTQAGGCLEAARKIASRIAAMPPLAIAAIKQTLANGADLPLPAALALENREFLLLFDTQDQKEGMAAFIEKRKPVFRGV
jgi:enoyl-CoA hydratase/carnithine racemase